MDVPRFSLAVLCAAALAACASTRPAKPPPAKRSSSDHPAPLVWPQLPGPAKPTVKVLAGSPPRDMGAVNGWNVIRHGEPGKMELFVLSKKPLPSQVKVTSSMDWSFDIDGVKSKTEFSFDGNFKTILFSSTPAKSKKGTIVVLSTAYAGKYGFQQHAEMGFSKMVPDGWEVIWSYVDPYRFDYNAGKTEPTLPQVAETLSQRIDATIAWEADAIATVLSVRERERQTGTPRLPVVYYGISAGAFVVPALAARHGPPDAAILACGSASVGELLFATGLPGARATIKLANGRGPTLWERRQLARLTREAAHLEPEKLAPYLHGTPTLLLTAGQDAVVPTRLQRELAAALGEPERWHRPGGHILAISRLPAQWPQINKWLERTVVLPSRQHDQAAP